MSKEIRYGIFGERKVTREDDGSIEMLAVIQESGLYVGAPPAELRIRDLIAPHDEEFAKEWCAKLNKNTDLPFYLTKVKVKVTDEIHKTEDKDLSVLTK